MYISDFLTPVADVGYLLDLHCVLCYRTTSSCRGRVDESAKGFLCRRTTSMEQSAGRTEATVVDHDFSSPTENIFVPVCLRKPFFCKAPSVFQ